LKAFNLDTNALDKSNLLKEVRVNVNDKTIPDEFVKWVHAGGKVLPGLYCIGTLPNRYDKTYQYS
jgi:lysozyme